LIQDRISDDTFLNCLVWSGSDIIYPGGAPNLGGTYRHLDHAATTALAKSIDRYMSIVDTGFPMPTVAGGIYPGQLQAYFELLGPNVAYFIGGGISLHNEGPIKGAELCVKMLTQAREARDRAPSGSFADNVNARLIESAEQSYSVPNGADLDTFRYISPRNDLQNAPGLKPWFRR
jgi:ribulose 1,5-bisphosphate carboxylase large subunit-like protein